MSSDDKDKLLQLVRDARLQYALREQREEHDAEVEALKDQHKRELLHARTSGRADGLAEALERAGGGLGKAAPAHPAMTSRAPKLGKVIEDFVGGFRGKKAEMLKKHQAVLPLFLEVVGDRPVDAVKQADINRFFELIQKLPPRWRDEVKRRKVSAFKLAGAKHARTMAPKTFEDTYKACIRSFLDAARRDWQDEGFPTTLTTKGIQYSGDRPDGEAKQRAFKHAELKRLFEGTELRGLGAKAATLHKFWLPHVGLFTGARANEICQLNPQLDITDEGGVWHFRFTEDTEAAPGIRKSIKNKSSVRRVPVHSQLVELGFLEHVQALRDAGEKQLFPEWTPKRGKASPNAEKWFRRFIGDIGLRDEAPGARLVGMHAFRHTLLSRANDLGVDRAIEITGHAGEESAVVRGYRSELALERKREILERITFEVSLKMPTAAIGARPRELRDPHRRKR